MKKIVFGSSNHWTSPYQVGSHAWARLFAAHGWKVAYFSDPVTPWHWLGGSNRERTRERVRLWKSGGISVGDPPLYAWTPGSLIAPQARVGFRSPWILKNWERFCFPTLQSRIRKWGCEAPDVLWLDSVRHAGWGARVKPKIKVLRVADWSPGFSTLPQSVLELERRLIEEADLVIVSAEALERRLRRIRGDRPIEVIRNGVEAAFWLQLQALPAEYAHIPEPRVVYVGALDEWFDFDLMEEVARSMPHVSFVMIGQRRVEMKGEKTRNIHWLGSRPREHIRGYLQHAQVGMIPFKRSELIECVCPLKLYEYSVCGLPVVATRWEELERMNAPAELVDSREGWIQALEQTIVSSSSSLMRAKLRAYGCSQDWEYRWKRWEESYSRLTNKMF